MPAQMTKLKTFVFENETHTLANALRQTLQCDQKGVSFCGYSSPHPAEAKLNFR